MVKLFNNATRNVEIIQCLIRCTLEKEGDRGVSEDTILLFRGETEENHITMANFKELMRPSSRKKEFQGFTSGSAPREAAIKTKCQLQCKVWLVPSVRRAHGLSLS